jgi:hypothetical protein
MPTKSCSKYSSLKKIVTITLQPSLLIDFSCVKFLHPKRFLMSQTPMDIGGKLPPPPPVDPCRRLLLQQE